MLSYSKVISVFVPTKCIFSLNNLILDDRGSIPDRGRGFLF
jgi:hypothetical protein